MEHSESRLNVLARIPDLSSPGSGCKGGSLPAESGRLISQAASFRVLAATAVLLAAAAIVPFSLRQKATAPPATVTTPSPTQASELSPSSAAAALWPSRVSDAPSPQPSVAGVRPKQVDETPQMSVWLNPANATSGHTESWSEGTQSGSDRLPAACLPLLQADAHSARPEPASAQLKDLFEKPLSKNTHDHARSSVH